MAVNSITFGNINSADYGIYISGEGVFDAPKRAVEMVNVPGRSGAIALDQGYYENITVTYPAFNYEGTMADFKQALSDFRNALASQVGYQRLSDTFHPDEYRMAVFDEGLDINPIKYNTASQFDIKFDCKPQRYLTSGEAEITVESGDILTNPTQYESSPLLEIEGYGTIAFNGYEVELENAVMGDVTVIQGGTYNGTSAQSNSFTFTFDANAFNVGDEIVIPSGKYKCRLGVDAYAEGSYKPGKLTSLTATGNTLAGASTATSAIPASPGSSINNYEVATTLPDITFYVGTSATIHDDASLSGTVELSGGTTRSFSNILYKIYVYYDAVNSTIKFSISYVRTGTSPRYVEIRSPYWSMDVPDVVGHSTLSLLGNPTYIDCDLGEAYLINGGAPVSLNRHINLGSDLPELASGENEVTFDNTITELKVVPRWYKL